jgi:hypothetical protein
MITDKQHDHLDLDLLHLIQLERETEGKRGGADHRGWTGARSPKPSRGSRSQGRPRLDVGVAVPARGRRDHVQCGRGSGGGTGCVGSRRRASVAAVAELPAAPVLPRSVRVCGVGCVRRRGEPRTASRGPHPLFIALCDGGPPTMDWLGAPDQGTVTSPLRPLGRNGGEIELTNFCSLETKYFQKLLMVKVLKLCKFWIEVLNIFYQRLY